MIKKLTVTIEGQALRNLEQVSDRMRIDPEAALAKVLGAGMAPRSRLDLDDYWLNGVKVVATEVELIVVGQMVGVAESEDVTVYGHVTSLGDTKIRLDLTDESMRKLGLTESRNVEAMRDVVFVL